MHYAMQFRDRSIVDAYYHRPPYPDETFEILSGLLVGKPRIVLDAGCGTGEIARPLAQDVERVDAVDFSEGMIEKGKKLPGGNNRRINWIAGSVEAAPLLAPYGLVVAASSLHWMDWTVVMSRFRRSLVAGGYLALIYQALTRNPWDEALGRIIPRYSTNRDYRPYNLVEELQERGLFTKVGEKRTEVVPFSQGIEEYIEAFHSMNGFSRERMSEQTAKAFDREVRALVEEHCPEGIVRLGVNAVVTWGLPGAG
jgi:SAM-dependent methyltransferase